MSACTYSERCQSGALFICGKPGTEACTVNGVETMRCPEHAPLWTHKRRIVAGQVGLWVACLAVSSAWVALLYWLMGVGP